jgi:hypothetical protein
MDGSVGSNGTGQSDDGGVGSGNGVNCNGNSNGEINSFVSGSYG